MTAWTSRIVKDQFVLRHKKGTHVWGFSTEYKTQPVQLQGLDEILKFALICVNYTFK